MRRVDILLIEPVRLCAIGLRHLLLGSHYTVAEEVRSAASSLVFANGASPQLVILGPGASALTEGREKWMQRQQGAPSRSRVVAFVDTGDTARVHHLASSGVDAVLSQDIPGDVLLRSLDLVMLGQQLFPPLPFQPSIEVPPNGAPLSGASLGARPAPAPFPVLASRGPPHFKRGQEREVILSQREGQVLRWLVNGASNKVIARELQITETTVKAHIKGLLRKVRATNRTQAAIWALENEVQTWGAPDQRVVLPDAGTAGRHAGL